MNIGRPVVLQCDDLRAAVSRLSKLNRRKQTQTKEQDYEIEYPSFHYRIKNILETREVTLRQENSF